MESNPCHGQDRNLKIGKRSKSSGRVEVKKSKKKKKQKRRKENKAELLLEIVAHL